LWRRPIFNTRDEPHADAEKWIRLHMISGDANMNPRCTALKVGLLKLALTLLNEGKSPSITIKDPVKAFKSVSRDLSFEFPIGPTNAYEVFESYFAAYYTMTHQSEELDWVVATSRTLLSQIKGNWDEFRKSVDWASKLHLLRQVVYESDQSWRAPALMAYDLEYSNISREDGLFYALEEMGEVETSLPSSTAPQSRGLARSKAIDSFRDDIVSVGWRSITFKQGTVELLPDVAYPMSIWDISDVETFIKTLKEINDPS
ncbi:MAG TPA: proteasome accessory factor PafA2 family protein, partial [Fimbriimonas sp.]|nr:proteasome accessory factor PafA2 family protein [Fimbriimonas sp.]